MRRPSSAATTSRTSSSGVSVAECSSTRSPSARSPLPPLAVHAQRARGAEQLDLQAVERDGDLALGRDLLDQPVGELLGPRGRVEAAPPSRSAIAAMRATSCRAVQCSAASRMSALVAKCQVVEESETPASAATRRCVTAATPSRATIRTVAATIASRTRLEASARAGT